jgi:hypothetical protein
MKYKIDKEFGSVEKLLKRASRAKMIHEQWRSQLEEAFDYTMPERETFRRHAEGEVKSRHIYDSTAVIAVDVYANKIQHGFFPEWMWFLEFRAGNDIPKDDRGDLDEELLLNTEQFFGEFQQSNFSTELTPALKEYSISTGCLEVNPGRMGYNEPSFNFTAVPISELYPEKPPYGEIKSSWREHKMEVGHIKETWPKADIPKELKIRTEKDKTSELTIWNAHLYNYKKDRYCQYIIDAGSKHVLFAQKFKTKRRIVFRESVTAGETLGRGPVLRLLADIQTVNKVKDFILRNGALQMAGMYTGVDDGIFNPNTVRIAPGVVIPVSSNNMQNPTLTRLTPSGDIGLGQLILKDLQDNINKSLFADPLGDVADPVKSSMENMLRHQDNASRSGTSFGRLTRELVIPMVQACVDILREKGKFPDLKVDGKTVQIKMVSPLAKQKELEDFNNSQIYFQNVMQLPEPVLMATVPLERFPKYWQETLNVPPYLAKTEQEVGVGMKMVAQAMQQQQEE